MSAFTFTPTMFVPGTWQRIGGIGLWLLLGMQVAVAQVGAQLTSGAPGDFFGTAIAMDSTYVYVGAPEDDTQGEGAGALYIYKENDLGDWIQIAKLMAPDGTDGARFGSAVAVSGAYLLVGAPRNNAAGEDAGAAYVFRQAGPDAWTQQTKLLAPEPIGGALFGSAVALQDEVAVVTATLADETGAAYIFTRADTAWTARDRLVGSGAKSSDRFGTAVALDGNHLMIGAPAEPVNGTGAVYVFEGSGGTWIERARLTSGTGSLGDRFGGAVALEGEFAVVGAQRDDGLSNNAGRAYIYRKTGGTWTQASSLTASDPEEGAEFGFSVDLSEAYILVGTVTGGTTYIFQRWSDQLWTERAKLALPDAEELAARRSGPVVVNRRRGGIGSTRFPGSGQVQIVSFEDLEPPELTAPANEASLLEPDLALQWNAYPSAESYRMQVAKQPDFATPVVDVDALDVPAYAVSGLPFGTTYYWRVLARTPDGLAIWSPLYQFATRPGGSTRVVLVAPAEGATQQPLNLTLTWQDVAGATGYDLQVSTQPNFTTADVANEANLQGTTFQLTGLNPLTTYYWRVLASNAGGNNWSTSRQFTTATGVPARVVLNRPEAGLPNQPITLTLEWEAVAGATSYTVEVDTDAAFTGATRRSNSVAEATHQVADLAYGTTYYWRVQARNVYGAAPWSEVWRFVTLRGGATQVVLTAPAHEATGLPLNPVLAWEAVPGAGSYQVQVSTEVNFASVVIDAVGVVPTQYTAAGLSPNMTYYWRVLASNAGGNNWSATRQFATATGIPARVGLAAPEDEATDTDVALALVWNPAAEATHYALQVAVTPDFAGPVVSLEAVSDTAYALTGLDHGTLYHWRVQARNAFGVASWSAVRRFITLPGGATRVHPATPADAAEVQGVAASLTWGAVAGATGYHLQVSLQRAFNDPLIDAPGLADTTFALAGLNPNTAYFWRVRASNAGAFNWSETWAFSTSEQPPAVPVLVAPADSAAGVESRPRFVWHAASLATSYHLEVSTAPDFTEALFQVGLSDTTFHAVDLEFGTTYYWRVQARNAGGEVWSAVYQFHTVTNVATETDRPDAFSLAQNYPNPLRAGATTTLAYTLPHPEHTRLVIYDVQGREVQRLVEGIQGAGRHTVTWQGPESGVFFCRMQAGPFSALRKIVVVR